MRKLTWFSVGFGMACLIGALFYGGWLLLCATVMFILAGLLTVFGKGSKVCALLRLIAVGGTVGFLWFGIYDMLFVAIPRIADGQTLSVTMEASDYSYKTDYGSAVEGFVTLNDKEYRVKAYLHNTEPLAPGDTFFGKFRFRLTTDGGLENPTNHRSEGIFLLAYPIGSTTVTHTDEVPLRYYPARWRQGILNRISEIFPEDSGVFVSALLLGERSGMSYEMNTAFKTSGISHIVAVSGLHVSILFGLLYTLLARRRVLSCIIGIPALFLFAAIAGFTPSITRACIMQALMLIAMVIDREYDGLTALSVAVLAMLMANPLTILSVSFQLSVCCIAGILLFSERIRNYFLEIIKRHIKRENMILNRICKGVAISVAVSLSATVMTTPLAAYYFGCVSILSVLTNLLTMWIISFIFYGIVICLLFSLVSLPLARVLGGLLWLPIQYVFTTAKVISKFPMAAVYTSNVYVIVWLIGVYAMLAIFLFQKKKNPKLLTVCILFTFLITQLLSWFEPMQDEFRVSMLDVGQGQSILLQSDGKTFLVDCGGDDDIAAADVTAENLLSQGISRLDGIIVTHFDEDHSGGVVHLLSRIQTDRLMLPDVQDSQAIQQMTQATSIAVEYIGQDVQYTFGSTEMTLFAPNSAESDNENSICILFQREDCAILITGDRGIVGEKTLLEAYSLPKVDVLVAGHHGSAGSTSQDLLDTVSPQYVFISVGENNKYGHPAQAVIQRLLSSGCKIYRTDISGTIIFRR